MNTLSSVRRTLVPVAVILLAPLAAHAQERQLFTWSGRVDREVRLTIRGSQLTNSNEESIQNRGRFLESAGLPAEAGTVRVVSSGRGNVDVIQQPNANNGYIAVVRLIDGEGGAGTYRVSAYFTPADGRFGNTGRGRNDNGRGNDDRNDDRGNRRDRRDDDERYRDRTTGRYGSRDDATLRWSGDVDGESQIIWRVNGVTQRTLSGATAVVRNSSVSGNASDQRSGRLTLTASQGRGRIEVVQQPSAQNRYTAIIRIVDTQAGYGRYEFEAAWQ